MNDYYISLLRSEYNIDVSCYVIMLEWSAKKLWGGLLVSEALSQLVILFDERSQPVCIPISSDGVQGTPKYEPQLMILPQKRNYKVTNTSCFDGEYTMVKAYGVKGAPFDSKQTAKRYIDMRWVND